MTSQRAPERGPTEPGASASHARRRSAGAAWLRETAIILVSAFVLSFLVKTFLVQAFFIPSESMEDTLVRGDRVLVSKLTPGPFDLHRGDIVVFKDPGSWLGSTADQDQSALGEVLSDALTWVGLLPQDAGQHLIKRLIGLPGDRVACEGAGSPLTVNGVAIDEPYLAEGATPCDADRPFDTVVPAGHVWVMGDNRQDSADSRWHMGDPGGGAVPMDNIVGLTFVKVWPLDRAGALRNPSDTFAEVPDPS
ncbi:signal peptidase I [Cellulomonas sp. P22]|uniref:signal peptidase I n=1 Tax=Cellulomonas sp. P22 TaxID=3373189 RepID=UPI0037A0645D